MFSAVLFGGDKFFIIFFSNNYLFVSVLNVERPHQKWSKISDMSDLSSYLALHHINKAIC